MRTLEEKTSVVTLSEQLDDSYNSSPQKRAKRQPAEKSPPPEATSNDAATIAGNPNGARSQLDTQPATNKHS